MVPLAGAEAASSWRVVAAATVLMTVAIMPAFLTGAAAVLIRGELDFGPSQVGFAIAAFFVVMSSASFPGGRLADRFGPRRMLSVASLGGAATLCGIAIAATSLGTLVAWMVIGGLFAGLSLPSASLAIARGATFRPGLMFGWKQSAPPASSFLAGLAVPFVGLQVGWRWAYVGAASLVVLGLALLPRRIGDAEQGPSGGRRGRLPVRELVGVSVAAGFGSTSAIAMGGFLVVSAVDGGMPEASAGLVLSVGSIAGIAMRVLVGWHADHRSSGHLQMVALLMAGGALGQAVLGIQGGVVLTALGAVVGYGLGYGWSGLLFFAIVRACPQAPASAAGLVNAGATAGAALGPALFGVVADGHSFRAAWVLAATASVLAAGLLLVAARRLEGAVQPVAPGA